jgi:CheY-like chemotaxis protein
MLIDLMMPNVNGFELVDYLVKHPGKRRPSVIVITAAAESKPLRHLDASIVHSVVRKPFDIDVVADLVDAAAATARAQDAGNDEESDNLLTFPTS